MGRRNYSRLFSFPCCKWKWHVKPSYVLICYKLLAFSIILSLGYMKRYVVPKHFYWNTSDIYVLSESRRVCDIWKEIVHLRNLEKTKPEIDIQVCFLIIYLDIIMNHILHTFLLW